MTLSRRSFLGAALGAGVAGAAMTADGTASLAQAAPASKGGAVPTVLADGFSFAAGGDTIGPYAPVLALRDPGLARVVTLLSGADAACANHEGSMFDLEHFAGAPAAENGGGIPLHSVEVGRELRQMGITLLSKANNHATDWGPEGLAATERSLDEVGIVHAGSGASLRAAQAPAYQHTPKGTVAFVSAASTFTAMSPAANPGVRRGKATNARPGISALRNQPVFLVTDAEFAQLRPIAQRFADSLLSSAEPNPSQVTFGYDGATFRASTRSGMDYDVNAEDETGILDAIREARQHAQLVVFSIHAHETASGAGDDPEPATFLQPLFHRVLDAGADMVVRHGPHVLNGIELYKGKPIFYAFGSLFFGFGGKRSYSIPGTRQVLRFPDEWFETAVAVTTYRGGRAHEVRLHPMTLVSSSGPTDGIPQPAAGADARRILERIQRYSRAYGTDVGIDGDTGVIRVAHA